MEKTYDYISFGRGKDGAVLVDMVGFVSTRLVRSAKDGDVRSFGVPLENVQGTIAAMFPDDFNKSDLPETNWVNVAFFNNEKVKIADRFSKAVDGKERIRVRVTGVATVNEYKGKKSVQVAGRDFHILWAPEYKGTNIGGGEGNYSYVCGYPGKEEGTGILAVQGFVSRPELRETNDGRHVLGFGLALDKAGRKIKSLLNADVEETDGTLWVDVAIFDNDHFARATQSAKVLRSGAAIAGLGLAQVEEYEGKKRVKLTLNDFEMLKFAKDGEGAAETADAVSGDMFESVGVGIEIDDDDLPF